MFQKSISNRQFSTGRFAFIVCLILSLTACGFHLRGNIPLSDSIKNMYLSAPEGTFKEQLEKALTNVDAVLATASGGADVVLNVTEVVSDRTVGTLDERGKANSYNLTLEVVYTLEDPQGKIIRTESKINEFRRYAFDPELVLESESEEAELLESMEEDAVIRMIRQLATVTDYQSGEAQPGEAQPADDQPTGAQTE